MQTPLHLLQVLTRTLNEHLADACNQAQADAQEVLDKLDREQQQLAKQLEQAQAEGAAEDKELTEQLASLATARKDAQQYAAQLQSDVRQTLRLAKGLERIDMQVTQSIEKRNAPAAPGPGKRPPARRSRNRRPSSAASAPDSPAKSEAKGPSNDSQQ